MTQTYEFYADLMEGKKFLDETMLIWNNPSMDDLTEAKYKIRAYGADEYLRKSSTLSNFRTLAPDICKSVVTSEDVYYALKNGFVVEEIHPKLVYYVRQLFNTNRCASTIVESLPQALYEKAFTLGYLKNGWTMVDVIRKFCVKDFKVLRTPGEFLRTLYGVEFMVDPVFNKRPILFFPNEYAKDRDFSKYTIEGPNLFDGNGELVGDMR